VTNATQSGSLLQLRRPTGQSLLSNLYQCDKNSLPFGNTCFSFAHARDLFDFMTDYIADQEEYCKEISNGSAHVKQLHRNSVSKWAIEGGNTQFHVVSDLLKILQNSFPQLAFIKLLVFTQMNNRTHKDLQIHFREYSDIYQEWIDTYLHGYMRRQALLCEQEPTMQNPGHMCKRWQFRCSDDTCISDLYLCDEHDDCGDGEDEWDCPPVCTINGMEMFTSRVCTNNMITNLYKDIVLKYINERSEN